MSLSAGSRLGPYEILFAVGAGGMGEVYKARDTRLDRTVAIKILPESLAADPQFRDRFDREARAISQLTHSHICTVYDVGEQQGTAFLVMEYLEGETLATRLERGALPLAEALTIAIQIASALDKAHRAGITHRDLKPANIYLTKNGAKLLDFGLAKAAAPALDSRHVSVHGTRATRRQRGRRADGHLCVWGGFLRDAYRQEGVRGKEPGESDRCHSRTSARTALSPAAVDAAPSGSGRGQLPREGSR